MSEREDIDLDELFSDIAAEDADLTEEELYQKYYGAGHRRRSTKAEVNKRRLQFYDLVAEMRPMTVRQLFYQATVRELVPKTEAGYKQVAIDTAIMRRAGELPYEWLADHTRWQRKPTTYRSPQEALRRIALLYRKNLWDDADAYVEIWLEKDALAGVIVDVTDPYDIPLMVARGYSSLSFLHASATYIGNLDVPAYLYHLGDFDPSGVNAAEVIERRIREMAPDADIHFQRIAVTMQQIAEWNLPTRPTKQSDTRAAKFGSKISVELDAIPPNTLRKIVQDVIDSHMPRREFEVLKAAEKSERDYLLSFASGKYDLDDEEDYEDEEESC